MPVKGDSTEQGRGWSVAFQPQTCPAPALPTDSLTQSSWRRLASDPRPSLPSQKRTSCYLASSSMSRPALLRSARKAS